jgi:hypothetical protein
MEEVKDQTEDPLVAPIIYVLRHTKEFINLDVTTGYPVDDHKQYMQEFMAFQNFLREVSLGNFTKTKEMLQKEGDLAKGSSKSISTEGGRRRIRSRFSDHTVSSAARGVNIMFAPSSTKSIGKSSKFGGFRRGLTSNFDIEDKLISDKQIRKSQNFKKAKDRPIISGEDHISEKSVSSAEQDSK